MNLLNPQYQKIFGPLLEPGSYPREGARIQPCIKGSCDLCKHVHPTKMLVSPWDGGNWRIHQNICCSLNNIVHLIYCDRSDHKDYSWYVGSAVDMKKRWRNHRSDYINMKTTKSGLAHHAAF